MPGMIDTHRHMWQTAMRGYGADWTLTQYFVWYYLESGKHFRPEDVHAGNLLAALEAVDAGVTTCVDWSHGLQTTGHAEAAVDACARCPAASCSPTATSSRARGSGRPRTTRRSPGGRSTRPTTCSASRWPSTSPATPFPSAPPSRRPRAGRPGHHPRRRLGRDERRRHPPRPRGRIHGRDQRARARLHAVGRLLPADRGDRRLRLAGHRERAERRPGLPADLGAARVRHPGVAVDGHQRVVERRPVLRHAQHAERRPLP